MTALPMLAQYFRDLGLPEELVAVAPDTGRTRLASKFAEMIGGDLAVLQKDRPAHNVARVTNVIGDIDGKCAVMTDDMVDTAGTLVAGARVPQGPWREESLSPARRTASSRRRRSSASRRALSTA